VIERVILQGTLRGKAGEIPCTIKATRTHLPRAGIEPQIVDATLTKPVPLPEGNYELLVDGKCLHVRLENGHLLSRGLWPGMSKTVSSNCNNGCHCECHATSGPRKASSRKLN
jgi:hypothetical protein